MKKLLYPFTLLILLVCLSINLSAQYSENDTDGPGYAENCTTIMVGRLASTDGSVMTSHTCDGNYRTWLEIFPRSKYEKGTMRADIPGHLAY